MTAWSDVAVRRLEKMYAARASYSEIAAALGHTRGAVGGKIKRLNLTTRSGQPRRTKPKSRRHILRKKPLKDLHKIPEHAHPLVRALFAEMNRQRKTMLEVSVAAGMARSTLRLWKTESEPQLANLEACFNVLGLTLQPVQLTRRV